MVTPYVAEFWNSPSPLFIVVDDLYGIYHHYFWAEMRLAVVFLLLTVVGFGFHATMKGEWQLLDKLPMIRGNSVFIYVVYFMESKKSTQKKRVCLVLRSFLLWQACQLLIILYDNQYHIVLS